MSATIIIFPIAAERRPVLASATERNFASFEINHLAGGCPLSATALATKFTDHFLPVIQASIDLLEADEQDFEARCRGMLDTEGVAMIEELCAELQTVGEQMQILVAGLDLTRVRLRTAMARLATDCGECRPESAS